MAEAGIDEVNDGERGRIGFQTYVAQRMSGFGGVSNRPYGQDWKTCSAVVSVGGRTFAKS